jgi:5'-3' exonuclease
MQQPIRNTIAKANNVEVEKKTYHLVVDGNSVLKSSLVAKDKINEQGQEYGAVMTFLYRVGNLLMMRDFDRCSVVYDHDYSGILRWDIYGDYKQNRDKNYSDGKAILNPDATYEAYTNAYYRKIIEYRKKNREGMTRRGETDDENFQRQRGILQEILDELFVRQYMYEGVEGDDIIAYIVKNRKPGECIVIVSEDRDLSQLISDKVCLYIPSKKVFVSPKNDKEILGMPSYNIVLKKVICGDVSDNIKGVKGMGEATLEKYYPKILNEKCTLDDFISTCKKILEERNGEKKKPIKCLENAINGVTDGCQGDQLYEINKRIIDLSEPMLTDECKEELDEIFDAPLDPEGRDIRNVYNIIRKNGMTELYDETRFGNLFGKFERVKKKELTYLENNQS